jgi:lysophospholipase L1-like esterase
MRICFFGESFVNGIGDPAYQGWVGRLCARARARGTDLTAYNCGIRGATSDIVRATWLAEAHARLVDIPDGAIVFSFGTNDSRIEEGRPRIDAARQAENVRAILTDAIKRWPALFVGPPFIPTYAHGGPRETEHAARCAAMAHVCAAMNVPYFDTLVICPSFTTWTAEVRAGDGAHPGAGGYGEMAAVIDAWPAWRALLTPQSS